MKKTWLTISLVLNALLFVALLAALNPRVSRPDAASAPPGVPASWPVKAPITSSAKIETQPWPARLRADGISDHLVAAVAAADFEDRWQNRLRNLRRQIESGDAPEDAEAQFNLQHDQEQENAMRAVLGDTAFRQWDREKVLADIDPKLNLSEAEADILYQSLKRLARDRHDLEQARQNGEIDEADFSRQQAEMQAEHDRQLQASLGADRYADVKAVPDENIANWKRTLKTLHVDNDTAIALVQARQQWGERRAELDKHSDEQDYLEKVQALEAERDDTCRRLLGAEGFAQFQEQQDDDYKTLKHNAAALNLNDDEIDRLYQTLHAYKNNVADYQQRALTLAQQGQDVDWPAVQGNVDQFAAQTERSMQIFLGTDRFRKLKKDEILSLDQPFDGP